jgi:hypothetical protein
LNFLLQATLIPVVEVYFAVTESDNGLEISAILGVIVISVKSKEFPTLFTGDNL